MWHSNHKFHVFRLTPGSDLKKEIQAFANQHSIEAGWIVTCVGSLIQIHLRFANQSDGATTKGHFEIVSLVGTVSTNGSHLHLCASDHKGAVIGGHLLDENFIYTTAEIVIGERTDLVFSRENDGTTHWAELQVRQKIEP